MPDDTNYLKKADSDALGTMENFIDEIIEQLGEKGAASDDLFNDYPNGDQYHNESHTDKSYTLLEAATLLDQLDDYEETDSGLWDGVKDPRQAVEVQAAYTYGNAVMGMWQDFIKELNEGFAADIELEPGSRSFAPRRRRSMGPKDWAPRNKNLDIVTKYVKDFISEKRHE